MPLLLPPRCRSLAGSPSANSAAMAAVAAYPATQGSSSLRGTNSLGTGPSHISTMGHTLFSASHPHGAPGHPAFSPRLSGLSQAEVGPAHLPHSSPTISPRPTGVGQTVPTEPVYLAPKPPAHSVSLHTSGLAQCVTSHAHSPPHSPTGSTSLRSSGLDYTVAGGHTSSHRTPPGNISPRLSGLGLTVSEGSPPHAPPSPELGSSRLSSLAQTASGTLLAAQQAQHGAQQAQQGPQPLGEAVEVVHADCAPPPTPAGIQGMPACLAMHRLPYRRIVWP